MHCQAISYLVYLISDLNKRIVKLRFRIKSLITLYQPICFVAADLGDIAMHTTPFYESVHVSVIVSVGLIAKEHPQT